jgi:8-oxo-dGTP diphosphatase
VLRDGPDGRTQVVLVHRPIREDWSFPKGKLARGESPEQCALREVEEETGLLCTMGKYAGRTEYVDRRGRPKVVDYWFMRPLGGEHRPTEEVDGLLWVAPGEAHEVLTYPRDAELLGTLLEELPRQ